MSYFCWLIAKSEWTLGRKYLYRVDQWSKLLPQLNARQLTLILQWICWLDPSKHDLLSSGSQLTKFYSLQYIQPKTKLYNQEPLYEAKCWFSRGYFRSLEYYHTSADPKIFNHYWELSYEVLCKDFPQEKSEWQMDKILNF